MKNSLFRRSLIWGIIILFIGAAVIPSISGSFNDDYVNAYWKFDEGSGNTAYDSSGNGYDGTIYGATWTTDTPSGTGYALNFDGLDDYVDFDDHAQYDLGFNKVDDAIFSFYFKSTSTDRGIIYSISRGDTYGYNPGFHIALNPNGTIEVKVWKVNCGILLNTNGTYNDGSWHYAEIFYNGQSANPTVEIYIDNQFDVSQKRWACYFYSDQFRHADIGRNSYDFTDYFEGKIDEFKIINYPGGNEQNPPIISGPTYGNPGVEYEWSFVTNDPEGDEIISLIIDWGNGDIWELDGPYESGEEVIVGYTYYEEDLYNITAKSVDRWGDSWWSDPYPVILGNQNHPPEAPTITGPDNGDVGTSYNYVFNAVDPDGDDVRYIIQWGDTETDTTDYAASGTDVTVPHTWTTGGTFTITAKAQDTFGQVGPETTKTVTMPRGKLLPNTFLMRLLERYPNTFPLLRQILGL